MAFELPDLPYERDALAPLISARTLDFHHGKHHKGYVDKLNKAVDGTELAGKSLEDVIRATSASGDMSVFNNAAQAWNHAFYWRSMAPDGGGAPRGAVAKLIDRDFGSFAAFKTAFANAGATQFGSGWAWLVAKNGKLEVRQTANAETPLTEAGVTPLLTMDVWEHAYYLDYQNKRPDYIAAFLDELVDWDFVDANLTAAAEATAG